MTEDEFFVEYNSVESREKLKAECHKKLKRQTKQTKELARYFADERLIATLRKTIQIISMQRTFRAEPHILIVEDQIFSQKMLTSVLKQYTCHIAESSAEALLMYMEKCPDIVFLDIELPDLSGHNFAQLINRLDNDCYIIMLSGNHYEQDIKMAKQNNVKGFITKPYEKETIFKTLEQFKKSKKRKSA